MVVGSSTKEIATYKLDKYDLDRFDFNVESVIFEEAIVST